MIKTLYVSDLDGTLLNTHDKISDFSLTAINTLVEKGMLFTYATARSLVSTSVVTKGLTQNMPAIIYNGTFTQYPSTGEILVKNGFSREDQIYTQELMQRLKLYPQVYAVLDGRERLSWCAEHENDGVKRYLSLRVNDKRLRPLPDTQADTLYNGDVFYYTVIGERAELMPLYEAVKDDPRYNVVFQQELYRPEWWLEMMPRAASKASAIKQLKQKLRCERIVSFGDAVNDLPMFAISDESYAPANAVDAVKQAATAVLPLSNEQDAVAHWLLEHAAF